MSLLSLAAPAYRWEHVSFRQSDGFTLGLEPGEIPAGSMTFIVGKNGAGKSSFLRLIGNQAAAQSGCVECLGRPLADWKTSELAREVAYLPQDRGMHQPDLLAWEVVRLGRFAHGPGADHEEIIDESLSAVDATHLADRSMAELSGGERQRVWIAMALAQRTKIILLDEPTTFLDWQHQIELISLLQRLNRERGVTIVSVLHDLNLALSAGTPWIVIDQGRLLYQGDPLRFLAEWDLGQVFGVNARLVEKDGLRFLVPSPKAMNTTLTTPTPATPRCPVRSAPTESSSLFVEKAAADLVGSEQNLGDPSADAMLRAARQRIYYWPENFAGFCGHLLVREGGNEYAGGFHARTSRDYTVDLAAYPQEKWLRYQVEELIAHREATSVSHIASKAGVVFGDNDLVYGRRVDFVGDKMQSFYRLKDDRITQIGRSYGKTRFVINIDEHCDCDGRFAAQSYSVFYYESATGRLTKAETYLDRYEQRAGLWLPVERRFTEATDQGLITRQILFRDLHVISTKRCA